MSIFSFYRRPLLTNLSMFASGCLLSSKPEPVFVVDPSVRPASSSVLPSLPLVFFVFVFSPFPKRSGSRMFHASRETMETRPPALRLVIGSCRNWRVRKSLPGGRVSLETGFLRHLALPKRVGFVSDGPYLPRLPARALLSCKGLLLGGVIRLVDWNASVCVCVCAWILCPCWKFRVSE